MASSDGWDAEKMLDLYLHDYLMKKNMHETATAFRKEAGISNHSVVIDSPQGLLQEWWSVFYDIFASRLPKHQEYSEAETSANKAEILENQSLNLRSILTPSMISQQRPGPVLIPRDFDSSLRFLEANQLMLPSSFAGSSSRQQQQINFAQHQVKREHSQGITLGRTIPVNPLTPYGAQKGILPATGPDTAGLNDSINLAPINGWPLDASNYQQQLQILKSQPEISAQGLSHMPRNLTPTFPGSSAKFNYRNTILPKTEIKGNNRQMMIQTMQTEEQQNQHNMLQQQQTSRKKKKVLHSRVPDKKLDCIKAEENKPVDDAVESFLSHDHDNVVSTSTPFSVLRHRSNPSNEIEQKGFTFGEVSCLHSSKSKVLCCHFSSDGKFLASAGHEKKVLIWNMETLDFVRTSEGHSLLITEVRFRPSSTIFATSSFDKTVKIWDSTKPSKSLCKLVGHAEQVLSLDFHPRKMDLLCSCDSNNEMRLWNVNQRSCMHVSKGATKQVRFQPQLGKLIAAASGNVVNVIDVETDKPQFCLKGHNKEVLSICWDPSGDYIASVSEDSARLWSMIDGECIHELCSTGNKFQSCTFHPVYSLLLVIGGYQSLELWNPLESNKTWTVEAHRGLISSLADSLQTEMVASASHDQCVKLWK
ncbi:LisH dimerization motif,WD40/YVTN repeat-like-containing domain isoform 1 [Theobroma cacao]|uniref:LisH dimerization motif,WD40/YVTN repeat-like-containing domain isoform 1 n=1 Tax=Theobroma cacao TaxID=3641 RepID=A0A061GED6_THECC|nr:LisH dimerization motif,WD40/YVTN repeat-like-containing domain isoform 1 [Theobroma cacao]